jgi:hypothetical protein
MKNFLIVTYMVMLPLFLVAQTETVGTGTGNKSYADNVWKNTKVTYTGTGDTRSTTPSDYAGASGERNVFLIGSIGGDKTLIISDIQVASGYSSGTLCFGVWKATNADNGSYLQISYTNATGPSFITLPTGSGSSKWYYVCVDVTFTGGDVTVTFTNIATSTAYQYRLDDISLSRTELPITLLDYSVASSKNKTLVKFSTATETDNDYFTVERSSDGRTFDAIGKVEGAGNSAVKQSYAFTDENPLPGVNYYRIKQTDYNGSYTYTEVKSVRHRISNSIVTPGKTDGILFVTSDLKSYDVVVYNTAGQEVQRNNSLSGDQNFSIENLQPGIYFVRILDQTFKVLKY